MTEEQFVALARRRFQALSDLNKIDTFYAYEKEFTHIWTSLGHDVLEANISDASAEAPRKKKTSKPALGRS